MVPIRCIRLYFGSIPTDLRFSYGQVQAFSFCVAEIEAGGWTGTGECLHPLRSACEALGRTLLGKDAFQLDRLIPALPVFEWQKSVHRELYSMALHDLAAKALGVPLYVLLGGRVRDRIPLMPCLFPGSPDHAYEAARRFVDRGFGALKVKNFGDPDLDCALIRAVRRALPEGHLQSDPNGGYKTFEATAAVLPRMAEAGLTAVEDPLEGSLEDYRRLLAISPRPAIILDGPSRGDAALGEILRLRPADAVNLHPNMQGTFSDIRDRAAAVRLAGLGVEIGGTGYTGVGAFAHLHVAAALGEAYPFGELGGWVDHGMPASTAAEPLPIDEGQARMPEGPGHGGALNREWLERNSECVELS